MKTKILGLLAVALLAGPMAANAAYIYNVSGTIDGGATFSGSFSLDWGTLGDCNIDSSAISITASNVGSPYTVRGGSGTACTNPEALIYLLIGNGAGYLGFSFSPSITPSTLSFGITGDQTFIGSTQSNLTGSGTRRSVPEPGTLALLGLGLAGLGLSRRRKIA